MSGWSWKTALARIGETTEARLEQMANPTPVVPLQNLDKLAKAIRDKQAEIVRLDAEEHRIMLEIDQVMKGFEERGTANRMAHDRACQELRSMQEAFGRQAESLGMDATFRIPRRRDVIEHERE